jgi:protein O-GlcNAc transferase
MNQKTNARKIDVYINKARELIIKNLFQDALIIIEKVFEIDAKNTEALFFKGFIESNSNNFEQAEKHLLKAISINQNHLPSINEIALLYAKQSNYDKALEYFEKLASLDPGYIAFANLADVYSKCKKNDQAISAYEKALQYNSSDPFVYNPLGYLYYLQENYQKAFDNFAKSLQLNPSLKDTNLFIGEIYSKVNQNIKAINFYKREINFYPNQSTAYLQLGSALQKIGFIEEAITYFKTGVELLKSENSPRLNSQYNFLLYMLNHAPSSSMQEFLAVAKNFYRDCFPELAKLKETPILYKHRKEDFTTNRKIKIGYISKYFFSSTGERWILDLIEKHNKNKFEIYIYHDNSAQDETTKAFAQFADHFRAVSELDDQSLAKTISEDGIDIMVDLLGHVNGNRLATFVLKPAPVQVSWFGYFGTTGLPQMDYVFADAQVVKTSENNDFVEKVYHLPNSYCYFRPPQISCSILEAPFKKNGYITFGCFSRFNKINSELLDLWSKVLNAVPDSKLLLKQKVLDDEDFTNYLKKFFADRNINDDRLIFEGEEKFDQYFNAYNRIDIGLDTFPYGGGTTTMHAMLMGVPCISLEGNRWVSRGGGPLYYRLIGQPELIAQTEEEYIQKALELSSSPDRLNFYRSNLPLKFLNSPVCDAVSYTADLENAFLNIWSDKTKAA